jgi:hypothetical protein
VSIAVFGKFTRRGRVSVADSPEYTTLVVRGLVPHCWRVCVGDEISLYSVADKKRAQGSKETWIIYVVSELLANPSTPGAYNFIQYLAAGAYYRCC